MSGEVICFVFLSMYYCKLMDWMVKKVEEVVNILCKWCGLIVGIEFVVSLFLVVLVVVVDDLNMVGVLVEMYKLVNVGDVVGLLVLGLMLGLLGGNLGDWV